MDSSTDCCPSSPCLNESPPKKEGKYRSSPSLNSLFGASMKALPKRKGNKSFIKSACEIAAASMKALPERKGNLRICIRLTGCKRCLNESLSGKDGKYSPPRPRICQKPASMKAPPKRKGNPASIVGGERNIRASMNALPKRKGNNSVLCGAGGSCPPQ